METWGNQSRSSNTFLDAMVSNTSNLGIYQGQLREERDRIGDAPKLRGLERGTNAGMVL